MKDSLSQESRDALVKYRLERAYETLREADYNAQGGWYNLAMSRLYYACYYASVAVLISRKIETQSHSAVRTMLALHFVKEGRLDKEHLTTLTLLFNTRQTSDYDDFIFYDELAYSTNRPKAEALIKAMEELVK